MSLSSALFSGISGLNTLGNSMTVIGDNIANVNTVGFKGSRVTFQDVLSQTVATTSGTAQVGRGTILADISSSFSQGSFESTNSTTDLAIGGQGFFIVRDPASVNNEYYTRAGEFRFDKDGNFVSPAGYIVRGWALDADTGEDYGSITDITLQSFTSSPRETDHVTVIANLDSDATSLTAALETAWDGSASPPIGGTAYEYQTSLKVYDSLGSTHDLTVYYDLGAGSTWEYIITCNPAEDVRAGATPAGQGLLDEGQSFLMTVQAVFKTSPWSGLVAQRGRGWLRSLMRTAIWNLPLNSSRVIPCLLNLTWGAVMTGPIGCPVPWQPASMRRLLPPSSSPLMVTAPVIFNP